jgi:hypothetical protein
MRLPLVGVQPSMRSPNKTIDTAGLLMEVADHPGMIGKGNADLRDQPLGGT